MKNMESLNTQFKIAELIYLELKGEISETKKLILKNWLEESTVNKELYENIINEENIKTKMNKYNSLDKENAWEKINTQLNEKSKIVKFNFVKIIKYAAVILLPLLTAWYILFNSSNLFKNNIYEIAEIHPGTQKAILTLESGEKVVLENKESKRIFLNKISSIVDTNKTLIYTNTEKKIKVKTIHYNTLETPKGGEYSLVMADGSKVWMNAASKLRYPVQFGDSIRDVYLEGEAYFEVAENKLKPFIVQSNGMKIEVLGTSFSVSAYIDEASIKTTLVEGIVKINSKVAETFLKPGYQAILERETENIKVKEVDVNVYTSWKEGKFMFEKETLTSIMRKLERWYNIETEYLNKEVMNYHFSGTLDRYDDISEILNMIALTTNIEFKIVVDKIVVDKKKK